MSISLTFEMELSIDFDLGHVAEMSPFDWGFNPKTSGNKEER